MAVKALDNRYAKVKWGQTKWGPSAVAKTLAYDLSVDWTGVGLLNTNEAKRLIGYSGFRGRQNILKATGAGFEQIQIGQYQFTLDNYDGRFNSWNTASPLYPNVTYGKDVRFRVRSMNTGTLFPIFYGIITDIVPLGNGTPNPRVQIIVQDTWNYLRNQKARVAIQAGLTTDAAINMVLNAVNWPSRWGRSLDGSVDTIGYWWASGGNTAGVEIENLANSGGGVFFIDAQGRAKYMTRSDVPNSALDITQAMVHKDISPAQPWINQRNVFRMTVNPKTQAVSGVIWKLSGTAPSIQPGAANALTFIAPYTYNNAAVPANNVLQPVPTTDWTTNSAANGSGADKTSVCTFVIVDNGDSAFCTVTNNDAATVYLQPSQIKGQAIYTVNSVDVTYPADPSTVANPREFIQNLMPQQDLNIVASIVSVFGPFYAGRSPYIVCNMTGRPDQQFVPDLFNVVTATFPYFGISGERFKVGGIAQASNDEACQEVTTTFYLEAYPSVAATGTWTTTGIWDTTAWSF